jgi:hypothetical protein
MMDAHRLHRTGVDADVRDPWATAGKRERPTCDDSGGAGGQRPARKCHAAICDLASSGCQRGGIYHTDPPMTDLP